VNKVDLNSTNLTMCQHCNQSKATRPRGLCWRCYYRPGVRDQYPVTSKFATLRYRAVNPFAEDAPPPASPECPTGAWPGSAEKIAVMADRVAAGRAIFHPEDFQP
jgi:hypothetical protein